MAGFFSNLATGAGNLAGQAGNLLGKYVAEPIANAEIGAVKGVGSFLGGMYNANAAANPAPKPAPTDAPVPQGVANFKAGVPSTYNGSAAPTNQPINTSAPTQPQTNPAGAPGQPVTPIQPQTNSTNNGYVNSSGGYTNATGNPQVNNANTTFPSSPGQQPTTNSNNPFTNSLNTQQTYSSGQGTPAVNTAQGTLQGIASNQTPQVQQAQQQYNDFAKASPFLLSDVRNNPNVAADVSVGRGQALGQTLSGEQSALAQGVTNALSGESQQIGAAQGAGNVAQAQTNQQQSSAANVGSLTQPQAGASYFGSPVSGGVVGQGNNLVSTAVSQATQLVQNGADPAQVLSQLTSAYGAGSPAVVAFQQQMLDRTGGTYNPTAASASSQQTASQGAQTGGEAYNLSTALKQVNTINPVITNFLSTANINPTTSPLYNQPINSYVGSLGNPGAMAQYNTMMTDLQNFSSQIVASGNAQTPTAITVANALQNPSNLSLKDIKSYMDTLTTLGQNRLGVLQDQAKASGYTGYTGQQANTQTSTPVATPGTGFGSGVTNPVAQGVLGGGLNASNDVAGLVGYVLGKI